MFNTQKIFLFWIWEFFKRLIFGWQWELNNMSEYRYKKFSLNLVTLATSSFHRLSAPFHVLKYTLYDTNYMYVSLAEKRSIIEV